MIDLESEYEGLNGNELLDEPAGFCEDSPLDDKHLWPQDTGTLTFETRQALLLLIRGPYLDERRDVVQWRALLNNKEVVASRLSDLFLELCIDQEAGIAFARNASTGEREVPKAARSSAMTLLDTIMVLTLRKELQLGGAKRVFIGQNELFEQLSQYRNLMKQDQSSFQDRLKTSWNRLVEFRILLKSDAEDRFEISPVLKLIFGPEEAAAVNEEFERMLEKTLQASLEGVENNG